MRKRGLSPFHCPGDDRLGEVTREFMNSFVEANSI